MPADMFTRPQPMSAFSLPWGPNHNFQVDGHHYTSINRSFLPDNLPSHVPMPQSPSPAQLRSRLWSTERHPYLAFLLKFPFVGQWTRFATPVARMELTNDRYGWHLPRNTQKEWKNFEHITRASATKLSNLLKERFPEFNGLWDEPEKPGLYGYFSVQSTEAEARQAITESIDAFVVYMAYLSFLIALHYYYPASPNTSQRRPSIRQVLQATSLDIHPEWLRDLEASPVAQFRSDPQRVGSVVDVKSCKWLNLVPCLITANVPIWLSWGPPPFLTSNDSQISWTSFYTPAINESAQSTVPVATSAPPAGTSSSVPAPNPSSNFPPVQSGSGQLPGETMRAYFQRRKERHARYKQSETPEQRQKRLDREKSQARKQTPGKKGPLVYQWGKVGEFNIRIRTLLDRKEAIFLWSRWPKKAVVYDSFKNQYDCCSVWSFDPDDTASPNDEPEDESSDEDCFFASGPPVPRTSPNVPHPPAPVEQNILGSVDGLIDSAQALSPAPDVFPGLPDVAPPSSHMDIIMETNVEIQQADPATTVSDIAPPQILQEDLRGDIVMEAGDRIQETDSAATVQHSSYFNESEDKVLNEDDLFALSKQDVLAANLPTPSVQAPLEPQFVEDVIYYRYGYSLDETSYQGPEPAFINSPNPFNHWQTVCHALGAQGLTFSERNRAPIVDFLVSLLTSNQPFHEVPGKYWDLSPGNSEPLNAFSPVHLRIEVKKFQSGTLCLLHSRSQAASTEWCIAVDPMTSLECIRYALGPCLVDVAEFLVKKGVSFRTLSPSANLLIPPRVPATSSHQILGYRSDGYKFDLADFAAYETRRESFLLAQPQGRHALCYGGIVARLARETLPDSVVLAGPSHKALQGQHAIFDDGSGNLLVDDRLSEKDLDLICGTYEVGTGKGDQTALRSWFPRAVQWGSTGLNVTCWVQECEDFYNKRRADILDGKAVPLSGNQWRQKLRFSRQAPQLTVKMNQAALSFLQSLQADSLTHLDPQA